MAQQRWKQTRRPSKNVGQRLKQLREEAELTQGQLAELLEVTQPIVSDYETGRIRFPVEILIRLAEILEMATGEILGLKSRPQKPRIRNRRLMNKLQQINRLSKQDQEVLIRVIDSFVKKPAPKQRA